MSSESPAPARKILTARMRSVAVGRRRVTLASLLCFCAAFASLSSPSRAFALGFGCAGVAGQVVFMDTIYGAGTGLVIAGILELTRDNNDDFGKRLALGTAIGSGAGLGLGIAEVALRDCSESSRVNQVRKGFTAPYLVIRDPAVSAGGSGADARINQIPDEERSQHSHAIGIGITRYF